MKRFVSPSRGDLRTIEFIERGRSLAAWCPDDEIFTLARELILDRVYERGGVRLRPGLGLVVDAGAHVGIFSLQAAQWADKVVALEADPVNHAVLEANVHRNRVNNVVPLDEALWTESVSAVSFRRADHSGGGCVSQAGMDGVRGISLDDLIDQFGPIDLLKIDIEGAEYEVFEVARRLGDVHEIVGELHVDSRDDHRAGKLADLLSSSGFEVSIISETELYGHEALCRVLANRRALAHESVTKILCASYLLAPITKPIRAPGATYDLPLLTARRP
ncbi:MAG: FkbM family methyltransferase [Acidimicrobiales bacterium]